MKDHHSPRASRHLFLQRCRGLLASGPAVAVFFLLGYVIGLLSVSFSSSPLKPQPQSQLQTTDTTLIPTPSEETTTVRREVEPPPHDLLRFRTECADPIPHSQVLQTVLSRAYNGTSPYAGFPSPDTASLLLPAGRRPFGWGSTNLVFRDLIESVRPLTIIELGTFLGASALHMASITHNLSLPSLILCLDDFRGWPGFRSHFSRNVPPAHHGDALLLHQFMLGVVTAGESDRVIPMPFSTGSALAALCEWGVYGDLIEVDAGHDFHSAWADINMAYAVLRPGGVLSGHDYFNRVDDRGVQRAVNLFAKVKELKVRPHGQHWVLSPKPEL